MKRTLLAVVAALALGGSALAQSNEDPLLGPTAQRQLERNYHIHVDPVAAAIVEKMRQCVAEEPWRTGPPRTGVVLTDDCYREARGVR
jgi:hypothetical protein